MKQKTVGVLAFQGDVVEHQKILEKIGQRFKAVRSLKDLDAVDALIIPGGESTTIGFFLEESGLMEEIRRRVAILPPDVQKNSRVKPMPVWGTCAGAIVMAKKIKSDIVPPHLGLMDMVVERNAYGRQIDSFYAKLPIPDLKIADLEAAFIRAPIILEIGVQDHGGRPGTALPGQTELPGNDVQQKSRFRPRTEFKNQNGLLKAKNGPKSVHVHTFNGEYILKNRQYSELQLSRPGPKILATHEGKIVLVQQGHLLASTFHPELTGDTRLHEWFLQL